MDIEKILFKDNFQKDEIVELLKISSSSKLSLLYKKADHVKKVYFSNTIHLRGIIEFSNYCRQDCYYCGIRNENDEVSRYRMSFDEILLSASKIYNAGLRTIVLQSGEDIYYDSNKIVEMIRAIKNRFDVAITLSLGERTFEEYEEWKSAGADRFLLKHETANQNLYYEIHPYQNFEDRIEHLKYLKSIGFQVGSGNIVGLPNQTLEDIADDIILCKELDVDMASFSPFISADNTPYDGFPNCSIDLVLKTMAIARIFLKNVHIPATTALSTLKKDGRKLGLLAGANVVMPTFTPNNFRHNYLIYKNKPGGNEDPEIKLTELNKLFSELDLKVTDSKGHSLKVEM